MQHAVNRGDVAVLSSLLSCVTPEVARGLHLWHAVAASCRVNQCNVLNQLKEKLGGVSEAVIVATVKVPKAGPGSPSIETSANAIELALYHGNIDVAEWLARHGVTVSVMVRA